jgi:hypothetical protein
MPVLIDAKQVGHIVPTDRRYGRELLEQFQRVKPTQDELVAAFASIEKHDLKVATIICSVCGCTLSKDSDDKPCEHLKEMVEGL